LAKITENSKLIAQKIRKLCRIILRREDSRVQGVVYQLVRNVSGQIATLLTLVIVVMLIMVMVVVNIGNTSLKATTVANAADAGALALASSLATSASQMRDTLGGTRHCEKGGLLGVVLAVVLAIAAVVVAIVTAGTTSTLALMAIGAAAGAIGGFIGGHIMGLNAKGVWKQTVLGAQIGAAIGSFASMFVSGPAANPEAIEEVSGIAEAGKELQDVGTWGKIWNNMKGAYDATIGRVVAGVGKGIAGLETWVNTTIIQPVANFVGNLPVIGKVGKFIVNILGTEVALKGSENAITLGEALWNANEMSSTVQAIRGEAAEQKIKANVYNKMASSLNKLSDRATYRENAFLSALSKIVDDPRTHPDVNDINNNGSFDDEIPYFAYWWDHRTTLLEDGYESAASSIVTPIRLFFENEVEDLENDRVTTVVPNLGREERGETEGLVTELVRYLYNNGYSAQINFWQYGPTQDQWEYWQTCNPEVPGQEDCVEEYLINNGYDGLDLAIDEYYLRAVTVATAHRDLGYEALASQAFNIEDSWLGWYYDDVTEPGYEEEDDSSFGYVFDKIENGDPIMGIVGMNSWKGQLESIENSLPECQYDPVFGNILNAPLPCRSPVAWEPGIYYATIDTDPDDDFDPVYDAIDELLIISSNFRNEAEAFYTEIEQEYILHFDDELTEFGGALDSMITYDWYDAQNERHIVTVETKKFSVPYITDPPKESGNWLCNKKCWYLRSHKDDDGSKTKIKVTREDPSEKATGILGFWKTGKIERSAAAKWSSTSRPELVNNPW